jgi:hypothetical protein
MEVINKKKENMPLNFLNMTLYIRTFKGLILNSYYILKIFPNEIENQKKIKSSLERCQLLKYILFQNLNIFDP